MNDDRLPSLSSAKEVAAFLRKTAQLTSAQTMGRLIFALDATASRQPTWDCACHLQGQMFTETAGIGGLSIQLVYYRGLSEWEAGPWLTRTAELLHSMEQVFCRGGLTQIERVLRHALAEARRHRINALVFIGDCVEEEPEILAQLAGEMGLFGIPIFLFHEGGETGAAAVFQRLARLSRGAYCPFDAGSARQLRELLGAVAVYAVGGFQALVEHGRRRGDLARHLIQQLDAGS
jgi:hypothetical protein